MILRLSCKPVLGLFLLVFAVDHASAIEAVWTKPGIDLYLKTLRYFDEHERGSFGNPDLPENAAMDSWWTRNAYADSSGTSCLLAGYSGRLSAGRCRPDPSTNYTSALKACKAAGYSFPCAQEVFPAIGGSAVCGNSDSSRWTASCAANFFDRLGLSGKMLSSTFTDEETGSLLEKFKRIPVNPSAIANRVEALCRATAHARNNSDIADCAKLLKQWKALAAGKPIPSVPSPVVPNRSENASPVPFVLEKPKPVKPSRPNTTAEIDEHESDVAAQINSGVPAAANNSVEIPEICEPRKDSSGPCTLMELTKKCSLMNGDTDIVFADGSRIPSYRARIKERDARKKDEKLQNQIEAKVADWDLELGAARAVLVKGLKKTAPALGVLLANGMKGEPKGARLLADLLAGRPSSPVQLKELVVVNAAGNPEHLTNPSYEKVREIFQAAIPENGTAQEPEISRKNLRDLTQKLSKYRPEIMKLASGYDPKADALSVSEEKIKELKTTVRDVREQLMKTLMKGRTEDQLSEEERELVTRVKTIQFRLPTDPQSFNSPACASESGNAFYRPSDHSFTVCAAMLKLPIENLVMVIGHELAHSVDPCNFQNRVPVYDLKTESLAKLPAEPKTVADAVRMRAAECAAAGEKSCYMRIPSSAIVAPLAKAGVIGPLFKKRDGLANYPLENARQCLMSKAGGGFRSNQDELADIESHVQQYLDDNYDEGSLSEAERAKEIDRIKQLFKSKPECMSKHEKFHSELGEAMSDLLGSKVSNEFLKKHPRTDDTPAGRLRPVAFFASKYCESLARRAGIGGPMTQDEIWRLTVDPHPPSDERMHEIALREPEIRKYLGCSANGVQRACEI